MKIGYLLQKGEDIRRAPFNGPAGHVRHVAAGLTRRGHQVSVLFWLADGLWLTDDLEHFRPVSVPRSDRGPLRQVERVVRRVQPALRVPFFGYFNNLRFSGAIEQELSDCDVLLERMSWIGAGGVRAARRLRRPLALEYNGDPLADLEAKGIAPRGLQRRISTRQMRAALQAAGRVIATGDGWRVNCAEKWGVPLELITTVENGTDLASRLDRAALRVFQPEADLAPHAHTLVYLGGFYAWHGLPVLLEAFPQVLNRHPGTHLLLIGAGPGEAETRRQVQARGLDGCVSFLGQLAPEDYAPLLAQADVGLSPYCGWPEYSGLKIFDYKAAGLPVVASGVDGMPRSVRDGQSGLVVAPCDPHALAHAIYRLLDDPTLRRRMGRQARIDAETLHGWEHTAENLERVLFELLNR